MTRAKSCCFIQDKMWKKKPAERKEKDVSVRPKYREVTFLFAFFSINVLSHKCKFIESLLGQSRSCAQKLTRVYL